MKKILLAVALFTFVGGYTAMAQDGQKTTTKTTSKKTTKKKSSCCQGGGGQTCTKTKTETK